MVTEREKAAANAWEHYKKVVDSNIDAVAAALVQCRRAKQEMKLAAFKKHRETVDSSKGSVREAWEHYIRESRGWG